MADILHTLSNAFSSVKKFEFPLKFPRSLFQRDQFAGLVVNYGISNTYVLEIP